MSMCVCVCVYPAHVVALHLYSYFLVIAWGDIAQASRHAAALEPSYWSSTSSPGPSSYPGVHRGGQEGRNPVHKWIFMCSEKGELRDTVETRLSKTKKSLTWGLQTIDEHRWAYMGSTPTRSSSLGLLITNGTKAARGTPSFKGPPQIIICEEDSVGVHVIKSFHTHRLIALWIAVEDSRVNWEVFLHNDWGHCCSLCVSWKLWTLLNDREQ